ncbi:hypothetical protein EFA46_015475 (plasmid) [Halarchaeum sp. CBA1220]|uniref:DUF7139 domain-containing protein n=1 Tax=Halarchaeum sp. CBA1220 TaxID=1853682 RepID=UPI000F3A8C30|nr:hypothetical protein [Halarchaeum sp. CBA1220]QLC35659.1 hypothetical protein EFA46_015475 [Halarchaeum sp. CBA1220]
MTEYESAGSTLDLMDFKNVRDGGIVETPTTYAMLVRVEPREWLILSEERRESLYLSFMTFLRGVQFPTQILSMTTAYDPEPYVERFENTDRPLIGSRDSDDESDEIGESPLLDYGRKYHAEWIRQVVDVAEIRDREFYVAVSVAKNEDDDNGLVAQIRGVLPGGYDVDAVHEAACIEEVMARAQRVASKLPQTQVKTEIIDTRPAVLEILYEVYHGEKPPVEFTQGNYTAPTKDVQAVADAAYDAEEAAQAEANEDGGFEFSRVSDTNPEIEREPDAEPLAPVDDGGYAHPDFVERVSKSRILRWYARNIGPVGHGRRPVVPREVFAGVLLGLLGLALGAGALGGFIWSMRAVERATDLYWLARTISFAMGAASLPTFLLSLVVLFPAGRKTKGLAVAGAVVGGLAIRLFLEAYPYEWNPNAAITTFTVEVYAVGTFALLVGGILAIRSRQKIDLSTLSTVAPKHDTILESDVDVLTDGGLAGAETDSIADKAVDDQGENPPVAEADRGDSNEHAVAGDSLATANADAADERNEAKQ